MKPSSLVPYGPRLRYILLDEGRYTEHELAPLRNLGEVVRVENWGKRRLAHDIKKQREGTYAVLEVSAEPSVVKEFERQLRLNENVLRFLSTRVPVRKRARPDKPPEALEEVG